MRLNSYNSRDIIDIVNALLDNENACKALLSIYLDTKNENTINRYYEAYENLREKGHFDPDEKAFGISWHWGSFLGGFLFFWYRKQYEMMVYSMLAMFFYFFPSFIFSGAFGYFAVLNGFCLTIAKGISKGMKQTSFEEVKERFKDKSLSDEQILLAFAYNCGKRACEKYGGTDNKPLYLAIAIIIGIIYFLNH